MRFNGICMTATQEFELRFYSWALEQARREVLAGFPTLRAVKSTSVFKFLHYLRDWSPDQQLRFVSALLKRHLPGAQLAGEVLTAAEKALIQPWMQPVIVLLTPQEQVIVEQRLSGKFKKASAKKVARGVIPIVEKVLGADVEILPGNQERRYRVQVSGWNLYTDLDFGGRTALKHSHTIGTRITRPLAEHFSYLTCFGFGAFWEDLAEDDIPQAAEVLSKMCSIVLEAAPKLLSGLSPDDLESAPKRSEF